MRLPSLAASLAVLSVAPGCGNKSKLDADRAADVDALWELAPEGTLVGLVASPRAMGLAFRAFTAVREATAQPDLAGIKPQLDELASAMFGSETATPEDAGFGVKPFAMFATSAGTVGVMPITDRDKYIAVKRGTRGSAEDTIGENVCRELRGHYVCASDAAMFDRVGTGSLRGKVAAGARGDVEVYMNGVTFLGDTTGQLAAAVQLEPGQASFHGRWIGTPSGPFGKLAGVTAPAPRLDGTSGFVTFDAAPLLEGIPTVPIASGVTTDQLGASLAGPVTATIPAGAIDIQLRAPLKDPAPASTIVANCKDMAMLFELPEQQTPGACRIRLQGTNALELDIWVENNELRIGAAKGKTPAGKPGAVTPLGRELAAPGWTASLWGRGTMLNVTGITPAQTEVSDEVALGIHAIALVNELGGAIKVEAGSIRFRGAVRTVWANPPDVVSKYIAVSGNDILTGKATAQGEAIVATSPSSPFASDFAAGQGGLMIPAAVIGFVTAVVVPAIARYINGEGAAPATGEESAPGAAPIGNTELTQLLVGAYMQEAYPKWKTDNAGKTCPTKLEDLATYFGEDPGIPVLTDPWGHQLVMRCDANGLVVFSVGEDGKPDTADDVRAQ